MGIYYPIRRATAIVLGTAALSLLLTGGVRAQTNPDKGGTDSGGAGKPGDSGKPGGTDAADKLKDVKVTLNADRGNLIDTLRALMNGVKADFVIDDELKAGTATVHFKDVPFKDALTTLVKVSTIPIMVEINDGIYHFRLRPEPPPEEKPAEPLLPPRPRFQTERIPLGQITTSEALRKLTGPYDEQPQTIYYRGTQPGVHGYTSSFGLSGSGLFQSSGFRYNPDGSISRTGGPPINVFGLLRGLLGGLR